MLSDDDPREGIRRRDIDAFDAFCKTYFPPIFLYLFLFGNSLELAAAQANHLLNVVFGRLNSTGCKKRAGTLQWVFREVRRRVKSGRRYPFADAGRAVEAVKVSTADIELLTQLRKLPKMWYEAFFFVRLQHMTHAEAAWVMGVTGDEIVEWVKYSIDELDRP